MSAASLRRPSGGGKLLLLMAGLFAIPFAVVALLYAINWRPAQPGHHGELVASADYRLPLDGLRGLDGSALPASALSERWTLAVVSSGPCAARCQEQVDAVRRMHVALYKQMPRVRRLLLAGSADADAGVDSLRARFPDLVVATPAAPAWRKLLADSAGGGPGVFVIDPAGRVVMRYPEPFEPRGALRDVERLLKYSWIG
jgi:hypothetical protein